MIYLDHAATTPLHPQVLESMLPYYEQQFGNASSLHSFGRTARNALNAARDQMAELLGCLPSELVFTSGGTESDNLAILGLVGGLRHRQGHIITTEVEHKAVLSTCGFMESIGYEVTYLPVDAMGQVHIEDVKAAIRPDTLLISVMYGNNEVGTLQPVEEIGQLAREQHIPFHVDAVQALGKISIDLSSLPVDLMSFSAHKINGPKGVGALYVSQNVKLQPLSFGGLQERKRRAGTENLPGIIGFAKALELSIDDIAGKLSHYEALRESMLNTLTEKLSEYRFFVNGHESARLPNILNLSIPPVDAETLLMNLDLLGVAASSGSACSSGAIEASHVLQAMNLSDQRIASAVRFSFGHDTTSADVVEAAKKIATIVQRIAL